MTQGQSDLRCSTEAQRLGVDPIGSTGFYVGYLLVEWPLPWPREVTELAPLQETRVHLAELEDQGRPHRIQLILGDDSVSDNRRIIYYSRDPRAPFSGFQRTTVAAHKDDLALAVRELTMGRSTMVGAKSDTRVRDLLICTHGRRDLCCGAMGTALYRHVVEHPVQADVAVWRTSHTGGHRFAPTAMTFPDGQCWAHLTNDLIEAIVARSADVEKLRNHYRGSLGLSSPAAQAVERQAFLAEGWSWLTYDREARFLSDSEAQDQEVLLWFRRGDGSTGAYEAALSYATPVTTPACRGQSKAGTTDTPVMIHRLSLRTES